MSGNPPPAPANAPSPVILAGPSGVGKTTLCDRLLAGPGAATYLFSVSLTTRSPRPGENEGDDYRFVSPAEFEASVECGSMLEYATVHGERYGTPRENLDRARRAGAHLLLEIDVQGARQVREAVSETVSIFIVPPTAQRILRQLRGRGSETRAQLERRLASARSELEAAREFDYLVVNNLLDEAASEVLSIVAGRPVTARGLGAAEREYVKRIIRELDRIRRRW